MRTEAREAVLKILYSETINPSDVENVKRSIFRKLTEDEFDYADRLYRTVTEHEERIVEVIDRNITNFKEDRLYPVDRAILMIAVAEILYFDDKEIPPVVSVSEATNLAKKYSGDTAADFVNGVLSGIINKKTD